MDRLIYVAMAGAEQAFNQQAVTAHNLANATTTGYRAETTAFRTAPVIGPGLPTRAYAVDSTPGADFTPGVIQTTGRALDIAVQGPGFIAVQGADGTEAYTRNGDLQVGPDGQLQTRSGAPVLSDGGPLTVPDHSRVTIARDGTVSILPEGAPLNSITVAGRIKLVNPPTDTLVKGDDGLFRMRGGEPAQADPDVAIVSGALEGSNVNTVTAMVDMIAAAREYELHMKMLQNADSNAQQATQLLAINT
jgi:flagellar basal-body rod protein FlgF